jgi:hypothetical protein
LAVYVVESEVLGLEIVGLAAEVDSGFTALIKYLEKETLLVLNYVRDIKASRLDWAIRSIASAVTLLGLDEILTISIPVLQKL